MEIVSTTENICATAEDLESLDSTTVKFALANGGLG